MDSNSKNNDRKFEELRFLYERCGAAIDFFKNQQWKITNYAILLYAGLIGAWNLFKDDEIPVLRVILIAIHLGVYSVAWYFIDKLEKDIDRYRKRINLLKPYFSYDFNLVLWKTPKPKDDKEIYWLLIGILSLGFILIVYLLIFSSC